MITTAELLARRSSNGAGGGSELSRFAMPAYADCENPDIVLDSMYHGFGDAIHYSWVAEGAKLQGITIVHYAVDKPSKKMADLLRCFNQAIVSEPTEGMVDINGSWWQEVKARGTLEQLSQRARFLGIDKPVRPSPAPIPEHVSEWSRSYTGDDFILLIPQCTRIHRSWPLMYYFELQRRLRAHGIRAFMCVWSGNAPDASKIMEHSLGDVFLDISWIQLIDLMQQAVGVVGNNSACVHLSGTLDVPTLVLSGLDTAAIISGMPSLHHVAVSKELCPCVGCFYDKQVMTPFCWDQGCMALNMLRPSEVMREVKAKLCLR